MMSEVVLQKLAKSYDKHLDKAIAYYGLLSTLNDLNLQRREIELLAFTAVRGTITPPAARREFIRQFGSSLATIENLKGKLIRKNLLNKIGDMYRVNPAISLDFTRPIVMQINLNLS
jgi:heme oxygenase